ncbi:hypothetical protein PVAND_004593 [Polypedilum vanderplanki]|uniref:Uncharacterized protein n=1 Tax=Polypedilum vanderplanki TaxID=319348 RepID=A0A9J6BXP0_POLVA|nr:hypothetical protein PVAND_004593 [Polypedilum vanderplanki]
MYCTCSNHNQWALTNSNLSSSVATLPRKSHENLVGKKSALKSSTAATRSSNTPKKTVKTIDNRLSPRFSTLPRSRTRTRPANVATIFNSEHQRARRQITQLSASTNALGYFYPYSTTSLSNPNFYQSQYSSQYLQQPQHQQFLQQQPIPDSYQHHHHSMINLNHNYNTNHNSNNLQNAQSNNTEQQQTPDDSPDMSNSPVPEPPAPPLNPHCARCRFTSTMSASVTASNGTLHRHGVGNSNPHIHQPTTNVNYAASSTPVNVGNSNSGGSAYTAKKNRINCEALLQILSSSLLIQFNAIHIQPNLTTFLIYSEQLQLQILIVASVAVSITCQHYHHHAQHLQQQHHLQHNTISSPQSSHFYLQQHHPTPLTPTHVTPQQQHHYGFHSSSPSTYVDLDRFNQQAKAVKDQINYFNHQEHKNLRGAINSVHQYGNEPHFDFVINANYTDLEKASEQFVSLGNLAAKQNMPKVIKITKTVAVKQPVPVPYPVPVVHHSKPQSYQNYFDSSPSPSTYSQTTEKPHDFKPSPLYSNYTSYIGKYSSPAPSSAYHFSSTPSSTHSPSQSPSISSTPASVAAAHKIAESYIKQEFFSTQKPGETPSEYDTRPFYVPTSDKEMIKYIPVPYYIDENGERHELNNEANSNSGSEYSSISGDGESYYKQSTDVNSGKFHSYTLSYHPPAVSTTPTPSEAYHHYEEPQALHATPHTNYYYRQGKVESVPLYSVDSNVSPSHHYAVEEQINDQSNSEHEHVQYKYVYER